MEFTSASNKFFAPHYPHFRQKGQYSKFFYTESDSKIGRWQGCDTREGPGDLRSEEQMSEANRARRAALNLSQAQPTPGPQKMHHFLGRPLQLNLKGWAMQAGLKFRGCPTQPEPILESRAVYTGGALGLGT